MSDKQVRAQYTREFKLEAVRQVRAGQAIPVVAKDAGHPQGQYGQPGATVGQGRAPGCGRW